MHWRMLTTVGAIVVIAVVAWSVLVRDGVQSGPGPYLAELRACQGEVFSNLQHPSEMEFPDARDWHQEGNNELLVGGVFTLLDAAGRRISHEYSCLLRNNQIVRATTK